MNQDGPRVIVVGGSLGGLNAALWSRDAGCDVAVYERSPVTLESQGAGIVVHPATIRYLLEENLLDLDDISVSAHSVRYLDRRGDVTAEHACTYRFTSYNTLYGGLVGGFGDDRYHLGEAAVRIEQDADGVTVQFTNGRTERCDLLVCADGIRSTGRRLLLPDVSPRYAGYIAWRAKVGTDTAVSPSTVSALDGAVTYYVQPQGGHILTYPIPGLGETRKPKQQLINWLWYRNVTDSADFDDVMTDRNGLLRDVSVGPGTVQGRKIRELRDDAAAALPPPFAELVTRTREPFLQAVFDIEVPQMAIGRVAIIGDAAFTCRPHIAAGSAKAAEDAFALGEALRGAGGDVVTALKRWEPGQLQLGRSAISRTRDAGRRFQDGTWPVGAPLPFGLHHTGDSSIPEH